MVKSELFEKLEVQLIARLLNKHIQLKTYGSGVQRIYFTFMALDPENLQEENEAHYKARERAIYFSLPLNYQAVQKADQAQVIQMSAMLFLLSIDIYPKLNIPDFDITSFRKDVKALFFNKGWLVREKQV